MIYGKIDSMRFTIAGTMAAVFSLATPALGLPPVVKDLTPAGGQRGQIVTLTLRGDHLARGLEIHSSLPAQWVETTLADKADGAVTFQVAISPDAAPGYYPVWARTADGLAAHKLFAVGALPEIAETEPNDEETRATALLLPVTVNGQIQGTDRDFFQFSAQAGERWTFEIEARRLGSDLDPHLRLLDDKRRELAHANDTLGFGGDCMLDFTAPRDGTYLLDLHDFKYRGSGSYRLKAGKLNAPAAVFPLGWRRGHSVSVTQLGGNRAREIKTEVLPTAPAGADTTTLLLSAPNLTAQIRPFALSELDEFLEPAGPEKKIPIAATAVINGTIAQKGEVDRYVLSLPPGDWTAAIQASELGSPLDPLLSVKLDGAPAAPVKEDAAPKAIFTVGKETKKVEISVEDLHRRGGALFAYRLHIARNEQDYQLQLVPPLVNVPRRGTAVVKVQATRQGYKEPIQLSIEGLAGVRATGGLIAADGTVGTLYLSADADAPLRAADLQVWGNGGSPAAPLRRRARTAEANRNLWVDPSRVWTLPAAVAQEPPVLFAWDGIPEKEPLQVPLGTEIPLKVKVTRQQAGVAEPITISPELPFGWMGDPVTLEKTAGEVSLKFFVREQFGNKKVPFGLTQARFLAKFKIGSNETTLNLPPLTVDVAAPFTLELPDVQIALTPGGKTRLVGVIRRVPPFDSPVQLRFEGLPAGVSAAETLTVPGNFFEVEIQAAADAKPLAQEVILHAKGLLKARKVDYNVPQLKIPLKITPVAPAKTPAAATK